MENVKDRKALNAMTRARTCLVVAQPFFGCLALQLNLVEVNDEKQIGTMAVDGRNLYYHPPFVLKLSENECIGVIAHEVMHCAYKHMTRRGHRQHDIFNIAGDFIINSDLKKAAFTLPGQPISLASKPGTQGHLYDPQYDGMSTEEVYERLMQQAKKITVFISSAGNGKDPGGCGGVMDAKGADKGNKEGKEGEGSAIDITQLEAEWDQNVRMAVNVAKKSNAGNVPGHLQRLVEDLDKPKVNWRDLTRNFIDASMSKDWSWSRPNRRSAACGVLLPGWISDAMQHLVVGFDCSGSITEGLMRLYASEAGGALDDGICDKMTIVYIDTQVRQVDEFMKGEVVKVSTPGGGGTHFDDFFNRWVPENAPDASCIIFLTDMMTGSFGQDPDIPVLWAATLPHSQLEGMQVPFGQVIEVDPSEAEGW